MSKLRNFKAGYLQTFSFFFKGYKPDYYYWESVVLMRKLIFCCVFTLNFKMNQEIQLITILMFLLSSLRNQPFSVRHANKLEIYSLICCLVSLFAYVILKSNCGGDFKISMWIISMSVNLIFLGCSFALLGYHYLLNFRENYFLFVQKLKNIISVIQIQQNFRNNIKFKNNSDNPSLVSSDRFVLNSYMDKQQRPIY